VKNGTLRNVTLTLPESALREARHMAVDKGLSLSRFLAQVLEEHLEHSRRYRTAREQQLKLLERGLPLGTGGAVGWTRNDLHER
jgi:hypothetical protein